MKLKPDEVLLVQDGLGNYHCATAIFYGADAVNQANAYVATAPGEAVIAVFADTILIAAVDHLGISLPPTAQA